jgi:hypothetical protein
MRTETRFMLWLLVIEATLGLDAFHMTALLPASCQER